MHHSEFLPLARLFINCLCYGKSWLILSSPFFQLQLFCEIFQWDQAVRHILFVPENWYQSKTFKPHDLHEELWLLWLMSGAWKSFRLNTMASGAGYPNLSSYGCIVVLVATVYLSVACMSLACPGRPFLYVYCRLRAVVRSSWELVVEVIYLIKVIISKVMESGYIEIQIALVVRYHQWYLSKRPFIQTLIYVQTVFF